MPPELASDVTEAQIVLAGAASTCMPVPWPQSHGMPVVQVQAMPSPQPAQQSPTGLSESVSAPISAPSAALSPWYVAGLEGCHLPPAKRACIGLFSNPSFASNASYSSNATSSPGRSEDASSASASASPGGDRLERRLPHECDICGAAFAQARYLVDHKKTHSNNRPHKCEQCGAAFKRSGALTEHKRIHTGEKPFKCDQCDAAFAQAGHLARHKRTHSKPFVCSMCPATFVEASALVRHKRAHQEKAQEEGHMMTSLPTAHAAEVSYLGSLATHQRSRLSLESVRRADQPNSADALLYACELAGAAEERQRSGGEERSGEEEGGEGEAERLHRCDECDKAFLESSALAIHKKWAHGARSE